MSEGKVATTMNVKRGIGLLILLVGLIAGCESTGQVVSTSEEIPPLPPEILAPPIEEQKIPELGKEEDQLQEEIVEPQRLQSESGEKETPRTETEPESSSSFVQKPEERSGVTRSEQQFSEAMPHIPPPSGQTLVPARPVKPKQLENIYFDFDQATIRPSAKPILEANAKFLQEQHRVHRPVLIEGHCDERGSVEYNLVLGMRRALVAKAYLEDLGISPTRIRIVSYGKERPICRQHNEICWQKNRRAHFVLQ